MKLSRTPRIALAGLLIAGATLAADARPAKPIVLIGLDGVDWQLLDPLIESGRAPHFARLKLRSAWGHLRSYEPILSPLLWTTVATGKAPDEHGIVDFLVPDAATGERLPISSRERKVRALWNIFTERGLSSDVVAWWASWPAEAIEGRIVSDRIAYSLFDIDSPAERGAGLTYPDALWERIGPRIVGEQTIGYDRLTRFVDITRGEFEAARERVAVSPERAYKEPINHLTKILASTDSYHAIALELLAERQPDLFAVYYQGVDEVCHRFAHFMAPRMPGVSELDFRRYRRAVDEFYVYQDELLGELLAAISDDSTVIVISDHGFLSGTERPRDGSADIEGKPGKWHRLYGVVMIAGDGVPAGRLDTATLYDIAPTVLALAGLPLAEDMSGRPLLRRADDAVAERVASYETTSGGGELPAATAAVDDEMMARLAALGYIGEASAAPDSVTARTNLAAVLMGDGDLAGAESELRRALEIRPRYVPALLTLSQVLARQDRSVEALTTVRSALSYSADVDDAVYVQLVLLGARADAVAEVETLLASLREERPNVAGIRTALGMLARGDGSDEVAEEHFRAALALSPTSPDAMGQLFGMYRARGDEVKLEPMLREALRLNDRAVLHHNWLGLVLARRGESAEAERAFLRALELAPDFGGTMTNLGSLYGRTERLEQSISVLSRALKIEPRNLEARVNLGAALAKLGRLDAAIETLEEAIAMGVRSTELLNAVGLAYAQKGELPRAVEALTESLSMLPDQPQVRSLLAELQR